MQAKQAFWAPFILIQASLNAFLRFDLSGGFMVGARNQ
jgi:hypothetical protein